MSQTATVDPRTQGAASPPARRRTFPLKVRHAVLTFHIATAVALLGDSAGYLAIAWRTSTLDDPALVHDSVKTLNLLSVAFGIPLSFAALLSGVALGLGTRWGVFRYPWVTTKLALIVSVMLVGGFVIGPASRELLDTGKDTTRWLVAAATYDVVALTAAVGLSVYKPGGRFRRRKREAIAK